MKQSPSRLASLLALLGAVAAQDLPYNPTRILVSTNASSAYVFEPSTQSGTPGQSKLSTLDFTKSLSTSQYPLVTVSETLPFLQDSELLPFTPAIDLNGNITVIAGNCSHGANGTQVWSFATGAGTSAGNGTWTQYQTADQELRSDTWAGSNYLASSIAFSQYVEANDADTDIFIFGGMCPFANSTADTWTSAANYSNLMLTLSSDVQAGSSNYDISLVTSTGPPIAEAGFSITALSPTYTLNSTGEAQTQQQDFVLLGGHTQSAFINMSQVALFSLPQESWTFLPVAQPSSAKTDLAAREAQAQVEPRSGHTAVLSEDGNTVVLFGGWVGDISTPAQPQLAVLQFGAGYGGSGDWSWSIPTQLGSGLPSGAGIYGHGAAMLPGGVMMVIGGYSIPASSSSRVKRATQTASTGFYLYNTTSNTWIDSYTPPAGSTEDTDQGSGPLSKTSEQVGLGVGLAIGAAILILLVLCYFWYTRRLKRAQQARGRALLSRSSDGSFIGAQVDQPFLNDGGIDGRGGDAASVGRFWNTWDHSAGTYPARAPQMEQQSDAAGSTGLFVNVPSPTRGLRKGPAGRNYQYHQAPRYDDQRLSRGSANIHPIAEREDEDDSVLGRENDTLTDAERKLREVERVLTRQDPFFEAEPNPLGSHPVSPELGETTVRRVQTGARRISPMPARPTSMSHADSRNWTVEHETADPVLRIDTGRVSPSKSDERTSSSLSEMSQRSGNSITRTMSTRTGAVLAAALAARAASNSSPENSSSSDARTRTMSTNGGRKSPFYFQNRTRSSTTGSAREGPPNSASTDGDSFTTAKTNFAELQSQGEALLGGRPVDRDDPYQRALAAHSSTRENVPSPAYDDGMLPPITRRRQGWMGSLRRALNAVSISDRSFSMTGSSEKYADEQPSSTSSPVKDRQRANVGAPRRTVSDGGALLRQKRGQRDWEDAQWPRYRDDPDPGDWGEAARSPTERQEAEDDWDVEGAASKRDVQMMFTVPKARLRVVNADMDRMSLRSASDGALSRTGSLNQLRHEASVRTLRTRSDAEKLFLPATAEEKKDQSAPETPVDEHLGWDEKEKAA
ncbi:hypothetical protein LTR85_006743 [Meristemomyces frigidus]|nr:hypothetical protein LTR85_006743 [Meristemomyces frigidus]